MIRGHGIAKIIVPQGVRNEFLRAGEQIDLPSDDITVEHMDVGEPPSEVPQSLGEGERQAIAIAYTLTKSQSKYVVIVVTDDRKAREVCNRVGLKVLGTLGLIEFAKKHSVITKERALSLLERIPSTSLYVTPELLREARTRIEQQ
jgi:predicted nucleic acid-binding protein